MVYRVLADVVVLVHLGFVLFAVLGGLMALRWKRCLWMHLPAVAWAAAIEFGGWICPLTPLENWLRMRSGMPGYDVGFVEHYLLPVLYPASLTRSVQIALGAGVLLVNVAIYRRVWRRHQNVPDRWVRGGGSP
jgi:hypothetical protein